MRVRLKRGGISRELSPYLDDEHFSVDEGDDEVREGVRDHDVQGAVREDDSLEDDGRSQL
jgi:hypothetical protein